MGGRLYFKSVDFKRDVKFAWISKHTGLCLLSLSQCLSLADKCFVLILSSSQGLATSSCHSHKVDASVGRSVGETRFHRAERVVCFDV
ncbi:hypothetical protein K456DRAFT_422241 [Colletotrichum gloeosporioides 23]|nr:hypothetical protein K456DRAFT_422241 [Colletotrichum gloeosporioides 23]